jgi:hypothetical protein
MEIGARLARLCAGDAPDQPPEEAPAMPLNINDVDSVLGRTGSEGSFGGPGFGSNGEAGGNGGQGGAGALSRTGQSLFGDAGQDSVTYSLTAVGGEGGPGGFGGDGLDSSVAFSSQFGPTFENYFTNYGPAGDGGAPGRGGFGGVGRVTFETLSFDFATVPGGRDQLRFFAAAEGGSGGWAGQAGQGGDAGAAGAIIEQFGVPGNFYTVTAETSSPAGGRSGQPSSAVGGATGRVMFDDITVLGAQLILTLDGSAAGGRGTSPATSFPHGRGSSPLDAWHGQTGGVGGQGLAEVRKLSVSATTQLTLVIDLEARGGEGGAGGNGGDATPSFTFSSIETFSTGPSFGSGSNNTVYGEAGNGGNGGAGGRAVASVIEARIQGSPAADDVTIDLRATGGFGGLHGIGGLGAEDSLRIVGTPGQYLESFVVQGTPDGSDGQAGWAGDSVVRMLDSRIELGDGNADRLSLRFVADGARERDVVVVRNVFDGGAGSSDTIVIGDPASDGQPSVLFNLRLGRVFFDNGGPNTISGFEVFWGGSGDDRFIDGVGDHTYRGRSGADRFDFFARQDGADRIEDFTSGEDVIALRGFGGPLNSFNDVLAAATQQATGVLIQTSATSSVFLLGLRLADLQATDFLF